MVGVVCGGWRVDNINKKTKRLALQWELPLGSGDEVLPSTLAGLRQTSSTSAGAAAAALLRNEWLLDSPQFALCGAAAQVCCEPDCHSVRADLCACSSFGAAAFVQYV